MRGLGPAVIVRTLFALAVSFATASAQAAPRLDPMFGDHAVLQRGRAIPVSGTSAPGEAVTVVLGPASVAARAGADGRFLATLPAMATGGPFVLTASAASGGARSEDVSIGDVFLCAGQSNMEFELSRSQGKIAPDRLRGIRLMTIAKRTALMPLAEFPERPAWVAASPETAASFSAVCLFMIDALRDRAGVPIGAIDASWGGTTISTWMDDAALRAGGQHAMADQLLLYRRQPDAAVRNAGRVWEEWWRRETGDRPRAEPWQPGAALAWRAVPMLDVWEHWGVPELSDYNGMVWFQRTVTLSAAQAAQAAVLTLGHVNDIDWTWLNGTPVGAASNPGTLRRYQIPEGTLRSGVNTLTLNVNDVWETGGMPGPAEAMKLTFADGTSVALADGWRYAIEPRQPKAAPRTAWDDVSGGTTLYNAMIAPLGRIGLRGVAWYQGESDAGKPGYGNRLSAMMQTWRGQFGNASLPFAIVQLANFGAPVTAVGSSDWAVVRDDQRRAALTGRNAAAVVTLDLGDPFDIHPTQKREVGQRVARAMAALAYGATAAPGPQPVSATRRDGSVSIAFSGVTGALATRGGPGALGFELCGPGADTCRFADARVDETGVTLRLDGQPATHVRYAWADSPTVNLNDGAGLPVGTFDIPIG